MHAGRVAFHRRECEHTVPDGKGEAMKRGLVGSWVVLLAACGLAAALAGCSRTPPEQQLRQQLAAMQAALEQRDAGAFIDGVSDDFVGNGGMDRAALQQAIRLQVLANADIGVTLGPAEVEVRGDRATVRFSAIATGGSGRFMPERAQAWDLTSAWRDEGGEWRLYYAQWQAK